MSHAQAGVLAEACDYVIQQSGNGQRPIEEFKVSKTLLLSGERLFQPSEIAVLQDAYEVWSLDARDYPFSDDAKYADACDVIIGDLFR